jgi:hypothetical protein
MGLYILYEGTTSECIQGIDVIDLMSAIPSRTRKEQDHERTGPSGLHSILGIIPEVKDLAL